MPAMKRNPSNESSSTPQSHEDWEQGDPLWDLLDQASKTEPDPLFARNVVRSVRLEKSSPEPVSSRIIRLFTSRTVALGAAACACIMVGYQLNPLATGTNTLGQQAAQVITPGTTETAQVSSATETSNNLSELIIEETLLAAADDPSMFTRDEVVSMLGL